MPKFESPIGNKQFSSQPMKEFDVPDETGTEYPAEEQQSPVMRRRGPNPHSTQQPVDLEAAMAFQNRLQSSYNEADIERQIKEERDAKRTGKVRLNDGARRRIEMLVGMTRTSREVTLEGNEFVLQTLRGKDMREAIMAAAEFDGTVQSPFEIRRQLLARSIVQVAGVEIAQFVGSNSLEAKLEFIDEQDESLLNRLYDEYLVLIKESREKYAVKNSADAKEVVEDLKK